MLDVQKAETYLGSSIVDAEITVVRDVAPNKVIEMFLINPVFCLIPAIVL